MFGEDGVKECGFGMVVRVVPSRFWGKPPLKKAVTAEFRGFSPGIILIASDRSKDARCLLIRESKGIERKALRISAQSFTLLTNVSLSPYDRNPNSSSFSIM